MEHKEKQHKTFRSVKTAFVALIILAPLCTVGVVVAAYYIVGDNHQYVATSPDDLSARLNNTPTTAIVFGSGITPDKEPRPILQQRLDAAVDLYQAGLIDRTIVSGYHPYERYNEPAAMASYLIENGVPETQITQDTFGNNTFTTCTRAKSEFGVNKAVVITQPSHLDRAIYLCRSNQIEAYGYPAKITGTQTSRGLQSFREALSNIKAVYDVSAKKSK